MKLLGHVFAMLVAAPLLLAGGAKLVGDVSMVANFERWNYPTWLLLVTGILEIIAALLVVLPFSRLVGAGLTISLMVGAAGTHGLNAEYSQMIPPSVIGCLALGAGLVGRR